METNVHYPTDSGLLYYGVRILGRLARKAKALIGVETRQQIRGEPFRDREPQAKRLSRTVDRLARRVRNPDVRDAYRDTHGRLLEVARARIGQAHRLVGMLFETLPVYHKKAETLCRDLEHFSA